MKVLVYHPQADDYRRMTVAGLKVIEQIERDGLVERANVIGARIKNRFLAMQERLPLIGDVRGIGAMVAIELVRDPRTKEPATAETDAALKACYENGLLILSAGLQGNVVRCLSPLVITDEELDLGLDILERAIEKVSGLRLKGTTIPSTRGDGSTSRAKNC